MRKKIGRNEPCPCGSGKKYKRCCLEKDQAARHGAAALVPTAHPGFLTNSTKEKSLPAAAAQWPIARAYVPTSDVWRATGFGTAGIVRRQPDGRHTLVMFTIKLLEHGIAMLFGKADQTLAEIDEWLASLHDILPPFEEGPPELASAYIWGAWAWGESEGFGLPPREAEPYLRVVPEPPGKPADWLRRFVAPGGLTPPELVATIADTLPLELLPEAVETAIFTRMRFDLADAPPAIDKLCQSAPAGDGFRFVLVKPPGANGGAIVEWGRPIPKGPRSLMPLRHGLQIQGQVRIEGAQLIAETMAVSMAARLASMLKDALGDTIRLAHASWGEPGKPVLPAWVLPDRAPDPGGDRLPSAGDQRRAWRPPSRVP